ncbi:hypothetical protein MJO29_012648, partial [Puccinia striiformis f. sp. tritici]
GPNYQPNLAESTHGYKPQLEILRQLFCGYQNLSMNFLRLPLPLQQMALYKGYKPNAFQFSPIWISLCMWVHSADWTTLKAFAQRWEERTNPYLVNRGDRTAVQQILKPEDLRQDALIMQLHRLANMAVHNNESARKWGLQVQTYSAAIYSVLSFLLGIGDRQPYNILVSLDTLEIVHIDFGICFGQHKLLKTPDLVPIRLTNDFELLLQDLNVRSQGRWKKQNNLVIFEGIFKVALEAICNRADGIMEILKIITSNCPKPINEAYKHTQYSFNSNNNSPKSNSDYLFTNPQDAELQLICCSCSVVDQHSIHFCKVVCVSQWEWQAKPNAWLLHQINQG